MSKFRDLHKMFAEPYNDLWQSLDVIAEWIRALGYYGPGTYGKLRALAMVRKNEDNHSKLIETIYSPVARASPSGTQHSFERVSSKGPQKKEISNGQQ